MAEISQIRDRIVLLESRRSALISLLDLPDLGTLRLDVNQAIEELDDLLTEFKRTFSPN
jgi:hypothetical protein